MTYCFAEVLLMSMKLHTWHWSSDQVSQNRIFYSPNYSATAVHLTCVEISGAIGSAISGAVWSRNILQKLEQYLPIGKKQNSHAIYNSIDNALKYPMGSPERMAINQAYQETMEILLIIAICICVPVVILSLFMNDSQLNDMEQNVKGRVIGGTVDHDRTEGEVIEEQEGGAKRGLGRVTIPNHEERVTSARGTTKVGFN